ncbi:MAG: flagellar hook-basal body complex protein [Planctomycetes bacterium]|nr:flagellar hook-basal body complex protein [Planctomycetota bacterium]
MKTIGRGAIILAMASCAAPVPIERVVQRTEVINVDFMSRHFREQSPVLAVLIEAHQTLAETDAPLEEMRRSIRLRCDNLMECGRTAHRARASFGWDMSQGGLTNTGRQLDLAIDGGGFFAFTRADGSIAYTRAGSITLDGEGYLVNLSGESMSPQITVPSCMSTVLIDTAGLVQGLDPTQPSTLQPMGQIQLTRFMNPEKLASDDGVFFTETKESGTPMTGPPAQGGFGPIRQGFLEESNVDRVREVLALAAEVRQYRIAAEAWRLKQKMR